MSKLQSAQSRGARRPVLRSLTCGAVILCIGLLSRPLQAAEPANVMIVFDGSGSMWGRPPGERQSKLGLARDALRQALPRLSQQTRIGLTVFGHRRPGDCTDVEIITRPALVDPARILGPLERLNPKGKGPIALAIGEAARALGAATEPGSIVLVHDDIDNCAPEPCTAIAEIAKLYPHLTVHVVSIGLLREDAQRMTCFAQTTGGRMFDVQSAGELLTAVGEALTAGGRTPGPTVPRPQLASRDPGGSPAVPAVAVKPGLQLVATLAGTTEPLDIPVQWRVAQATDSRSLAVYEQEALSPRLTLPAGRYEIEARLSGISARETVELDPATAQRVTLVLNAGTIRMTTATARTGSSVPSQAGAVLTIFKATGTPAKPGEPVLVTNDLQSEIALSPGPYVVSIAQGLSRQDRQIMVVAGTRGRLGIQLPVGELELQAVATAGTQPLSDVIFQVFEDDPDAPQGRRELLRSAAPRPTFSLPAGTYHVVARHGTAEARERVTVRPGEIERRSLTISSATLSLTATIAGGRLDSSDSVIYRLERIDGGQQGEIARLGRQKGTLELAPGRYRIESRLGPQNARSERTIDLKAGARDEVIMDHAAGVVRLVLVEAGSAQPASDVFWDVRDATGRTVWLTSESQPLGILQAGRYAVRAEHRDRRIDGHIDVQPGDNRIVELTAR